MKFSIIAKYFLTIVVTILAMYFLFRGIHFSEIKESFVFSGQIFVVPLLFFFVIKILNTLRFSVVYNTAPNKDLFWNLCYSNMMLSIFPFRLGEISYINRLQKITQKSYTDVTFRLIKIRLFDYFSIYLFLMFSSVYVYATFSSVVQIISLFFAASLVVGGVVLVIIFKYDLIKKIPVPKIAKLLTVLDGEIKSSFYTTPKKELKIFMYSIGYWFCRLLFGYVVLVMLGIDLPILMISFISLAVFLLSLIPIQFFAGFGITEAGFLFFLTQLGFEYDSTLVLLLLHHFYLLIPVVFFGIIAFLVLKITETRNFAHIS